MQNYEFNSLRNSKILVIGGAGFIGSNLIRNLLELGNTLTSLDNYLAGSAENHISDVEYVKGDAAEINEIFTNRKFDYIFHFGEYSRVEQSLGEPLTALENSYGTIVAVLKFWQRSKAKLIYSGSSTKFANDGDGRNLSPYTLAKASNSELVKNFGNWCDLPYAIVYFYNVYGGNEISSGKYATLIGKFLELRKNGTKKLPVTLPGTQKRNFTHVQDIVDGIMLVADLGFGDGFGIGAKEEYSILDVCTMLECEPEFQPGNSANRMSAPLKTEKIKELGWKQNMQLSKYIKEATH